MLVDIVFDIFFPSTLTVKLFFFNEKTDLPYTDDGVEDKDEQDDERLHEGCDGVVVFEQGQYLKETTLDKYKNW